LAWIKLADYAEAAQNRTPYYRLLQPSPTGNSRIPVMRKLPVEPVCRTCAPCHVGQITTMISAIPFAMKRGGSADRHEA